VRRDWIVNEGSEEEARFRVTASAVRREVILDAPDTVRPGEGRFFRMRFTLPEAEHLLGLLAEAVGQARK
jgi:hypothetical protein